MPCKHAEDVCQDCLEKVHTTTEDAPPTKRSPTEKEKTMTPREKRNYFLFESAILAALGAGAYLNTKFFLKTSVELFYSSLETIDILLDIIGTRTRKE